MPACRGRRPGSNPAWIMIRNHVDLLSGKVHAIPTGATAAAADAAETIRDMCLRSGDGFPDVLVVGHDPKARATCSGPSPRARARASSSAR